MVAVVALKVADEAPAATVTDVGMLRAELVLVKVTMEPPVGAAWLSVTVQVELLELLRVVGRQDRERTVGKGGLLFAAPPVTVPPVAKTTMPPPVGEDAALLVIPIAVVVNPAAIVRFTTPTAPFEMALAFIAEATQENVPTPPKQFNDLPAAVIAVPEFTEMETTLAGG
jgi:hypothetical protein